MQSRCSRPAALSRRNFKSAPFVVREPLHGAFGPSDVLPLGAVGQVEVVFVLGVVELVFGAGHADLPAALDLVHIGRAGVGDRQHSHLVGHAEGDVDVLPEPGTERGRDVVGHRKDAGPAGLELIPLPGIEGGDEFRVVVDPPADAAEGDAGRLGSLTDADAGRQLLEHPLLSRGQLAGQREGLGRIFDGVSWTVDRQFASRRRHGGCGGNNDRERLGAGLVRGLPGDGLLGRK